MRRSQRWLPRKPAPPVTSARGLSSLFTSKARVPEAGFTPGGRVENVAAINDELRIAHQGSRFPGVEALEDLPFRHQHGGVSPFERLVGVEDNLRTVGEERGGVLASDGIIADDRRTQGVQGPCYLEAGRAPQVVRVRFEGEAEECDAFAPQGVQVMLEFPDHAPSLGLV